jgi:class 3 adenylate cyclase
MARALLAIGTGRLVTSQSDLEVRLERALEMVSETELALRADLLSRLADVSSRHRAVPLRLAREALELARRSGDPEAVITAGGRLLLIGCGQMPLAERRALADEISACSSPASGFDPRMNASVMEILVLLEEGRLDEAARLAAAVGRETARMALVLQFNEPVKALVHLLRGELEQAEVVIQWFLQETQRRRATRDELDPSNGARMLGLMRERDLIPLVAGVIADFRQRSMTLAGHATLDVIEAALAAHGDDRDAASGAFDVALAHDLEELSRDWGGNGMAFCCLLADGAFMIDHVEAAARLAPIVARVADRNVVHGMPPPASYGWGSYYVGVCQLVLGELDAADASLRDALERNTAMGARPFVARTLLARARLALARGDGNGALEHAREAKAIAVRAGLALLERQADEWLAALGSAGDADAHEGTTTFVFTDIVGSTASTAAAGDRAWRDALEAHTSTVRALTAQHGGRLVKSLGDGFMLTFSSARAGVDFAIALQRDAGNGALELRVGVHTGEAEVVDGDHLGHNVNLAARVSGAAGAGEILVSDVVRAVLAGARDISWGDGRPTTLKGLAGEHVLHPVHAVQP